MASKFPTVPIVDDFNRANENPATGWTTIPTLSAMQVSSNTLKGTATQNAAYFNTAYGADAETACDIAVLPGDGGLIEIGVRGKDVGSVTTVDGYSLRFTYSAAGTDTFTLLVTTNGSSSTLATYNQDGAVGDSFGIRAVNDKIEAWFKAAAGSWTQLGVQTSTTWTAGGYPTLVIVSTVAAIDNFRAGNWVADEETKNGRFRARRSVLVLR